MPLLPKHTDVTDGHSTRDPHTRVVSHTSTSTLDVALDIDASKIELAGTPTFDPTTLYDEHLRMAYTNPRSIYKDPPPPPPPHVRVRGSRANIFELLRKLDYSDRLVLVRSHLVDKSDLSGGFGVYKDSTRQRLVIDARPPNRRGIPQKRWTWWMASAASLCGYYIPRPRRHSFRRRPL